MTKPLNIVSVGDVYSVATWENCYFEAWHGAATAELYQEQWDRQKAFAKSLGNTRMVGLCFSPGTKISPPSLQAREVLTARTKDLMGSIGAFAIVIPTKGLAAILTRGVLATVTLISRSQYPSEVFSELDVATVWLAEKSRPPLNAGNLYAQMEAFLEHIKLA